MEVAGLPNSVSPCSYCRCMECILGKFYAGTCPRCLYCSNGDKARSTDIPCAMRKAREELVTEK